jgi:hypothetical protein
MATVSADSRDRNGSGDDCSRDHNLEVIHVPHNGGSQSRLLIKRVGGRSRAVLCIPARRERESDERWKRISSGLVDRQTSVYTLVMRPEGELLSGGEYRTISEVIALLQESFPMVVVVASAGVASSLLGREERGLHVQGMVLLAPRTIVREGLLRRVAFELRPVRLQTPTIIFSDDPLMRRVFGDVRVRSLHTSGTSLPVRVIEHVRALFARDRPMRFSTVR